MDENKLELINKKREEIVEKMRMLRPYGGTEIKDTIEYEKLKKELFELDWKAIELKEEK